MVTTDIIRGAWQEIITSHVADVTFLSMWSPVLDDESEQTFPAAWWGPLTTTIVFDDSRVGRTDVFAIDILFLDQTATDRPQSERDGAHSRMDAIARQCWLRFVELYVNDTNTYDGVALDVRPGIQPTFQPVYDDGPKHLTGVRMTASFGVLAFDNCMDTYFPAS